MSEVGKPVGSSWRRWAGAASSTPTGDPRRRPARQDDPAARPPSPGRLPTIDAPEAQSSADAERSGGPGAAPQAPSRRPGGDGPPLLQQVAERLDRLGSLVEQWAPEEPVGEAVDARLAALEAGLGSLVDVVEQLSAEIATLRRRLPVQAKAAGLPKAQLEAIAAEVVARMLDTFEVDDVEPAPPAPAAEPAPTRRRRSPLSARER